MARVTGEKDSSAEYALLEAIWRVLAADKSTPRRMLTRDLIPKLLNEDEGRWRTANKGKEINDYYLRDKLKKLFPTEGPYCDDQIAPLAGGHKNPGSGSLFGYHELHLADSFARYLGKGLPSAAPPEPDLDADDPDPPGDTPGNTRARGGLRSDFIRPIRPQT